MTPRGPGSFRVGPPQPDDRIRPLDALAFVLVVLILIGILYLAAPPGT